MRKRRRKEVDILKTFIRSQSHCKKRISNEEPDDENDDKFSLKDYENMYSAELHLHDMLETSMNLAKARNLRDYVV